jgi:hypothetical protein
MVPHLGPLKWKRSYLKIEEVLCPKPARGRGAGLEGFSGIWVVCPTSSKAFGQRKKGQESTARNT